MDKVEDSWGILGVLCRLCEVDGEAADNAPSSQQVVEID